MRPHPVGHFILAHKGGPSRRGYALCGTEPGTCSSDWAMAEPSDDFTLCPGCLDCAVEEQRRIVWCDSVTRSFIPLPAPASVQDHRTQRLAA